MRRRSTLDRLSDQWNKQPSWLKALEVGLGTGGALLALRGAARGATGLTIKRAGKRLIQDPYKENLWELVSVLQRTNPQAVVENSLRSETGQEVLRPLGTPRNLIGFDKLMFNAAQLATLPTPGNTAVDTAVTIGPESNRPLTVYTPLLVGAMGYGVGLSEKAKKALAKGSTLASTAICSGESGFFEPERKAADRYIVQYPRAPIVAPANWPKRADMIELYLGQGSRGGVNHTVLYRDLSPRARRHFKLANGSDLIVPSTYPEVRTLADLRDLVNRLRDESEGAPIGFKLAAGDDIEQDLQIAIDVGADYLAVDGAEGAGAASQPILQDAFGLPTLIALCRASRFLEERNLKERVTLIASGGLTTPEHFLKALALGADAVYIATVCLFAIAHKQVFTPLPWEPPVELVFETGKYKDRLDVEVAARSLANFLDSCTQEMITATRALGKTALAQVTRADLVALDRRTAEITGVKLAYRAMDNTRAKQGLQTEGLAGSMRNGTGRA